jgi:hypothetical protein
MSSPTLSDEQIDALLANFTHRDSDQRPLLKATDDIKFHCIHIEANRSGLLSLAEAALKAARDEPGRHQLSISRPAAREGASPPFEINSITRNERLVYKEVKFDGESNLAVVAPMSFMERVFSIAFIGGFILLISLVAIGSWTLINWTGHLF